MLENPNLLGGLEKRLNRPTAFEVPADARRLEVQIGARYTLSASRAPDPGKTQGNGGGGKEVDLSAFEVLEGWSKLKQAVFLDRAHDLISLSGCGPDERVTEIGSIYQHDDFTREGALEGFNQRDGQLDLGLEGSGEAEAAIDIQLPGPRPLDLACDQVAEDQAMAPDHFAQRGTEVAPHLGQALAPLGHDGIVEDEVEDGFSSPLAAVALDHGSAELLLAVATQALNRPGVLVEEAGQGADAVAAGQVREGLSGFAQQQPQHQGAEQGPTVAGELRFERKQIGQSNLLEGLTSLMRMP